MRGRQIVAAASLLILLAATPCVFAKGFVERPPGDVLEVYARAQRAFTADDVDTAKREIERVVERAPDFAPAYALYKDVLNATGTRAEVGKKYLELAKGNPDRAAYWYAYARVGLDQGEREAAVEKLAALEPESAWTQVGRGLICELKNEPANAAGFYAKAHALEPAEPSITSALAGVLVQIDRKADAAKLLSELVASSPASYWTEETFAPVVNGATGAEQLALSRRYLELFPQGRYAVWMHTNELDDLASCNKTAAEARAREVLRLLAAPRYARGRGDIFQQFVLANAVEKGQTAIDALSTELLASKESSPQVYLAIAEYYAGAHADQQMARRLLARGYESALAIKAPTEVVDDLRVGLGRTETRLGEPKAAVEYLAAVTSERQAATAAAMLGEAYVKLGDSAKAFDAYVRAVAAEPTPERSKALADVAKALGRTDADTKAAVWAARDTFAKPAAEFTLPALDGTATSLASYRGKVVLLNFWFPG